MPDAGQHTIKYTKNGDYGRLTPKVVPVEYQNGAKIFCGTCQKCVYNQGPHSIACKLKFATQLSLDLPAPIYSIFV